MYYNETFSPVAKSGTIRSVITMAAIAGKVLTQFDVSTVFLYGELEEEIYMHQPQGYNKFWNKTFFPVSFLIYVLKGVKHIHACLYGLLARGS